MPQPTRREARPSLRLTTHHVTGVDHPATLLMRFAPHAQGQMLCLRPRLLIHLRSVPAFEQRKLSRPRTEESCNHRGEMGAVLSLIAGCCSPKTHSLVLVGLDAAGKVVHRSCACPDLLCAATTSVGARARRIALCSFCADAPAHAAIAQTTWLYRLQTGDYRRTDPTIVSIHQRIAWQRGVNHHHEAVCRRATKVWRAGEQSGGHRVQERPGVGVGPRRTACTPGFVEVPFSGLQGTSLCSRLIRQAPHARGQT